MKMYSIILGTKNSQIHFSFARWGVSLLAILIISSSCSLFSDDIIAECDDYDLTEADYLSYIDAFNLVNDESTREKFIEEWILGCLVNKEVKEINDQVFVRNSIRSEQFLRDKNLFELENIYIDKNLDTVVTDQQIMVHYRNNRSNYIRKSFIVKALYLKVPDSIAENDIIESSFLLKNDKERDNIDKYGNIYGLTYYWEEDKWIFLDDLIREIPISTSVKENIVVKKGGVNNLTYNDKKNMLKFGFSIEDNRSTDSISQAYEIQDNTMENPQFNGFFKILTNSIS